ncbi:putative periplasmic lipoprotein [Hymenobacter crusticola]|uniref:hypothetical protein n=1 Tax=Hymenobacter crusticola TaxID=1770526 RepID=UPI00117B933F|nr:hypothetical protein [Hymenobacter crusticola]
MKILLVWLLTAFLFSSCNSIAQSNSPSESKGIDAVLAFYGGKVTYSKGLTSRTDDKLQGRFYELKISGLEEKIKRYLASPQLPASNCAYLFYQALTAEEKKAYAFVRIVIEGTNANVTYDFATADLAQVGQATRLIAQAVTYMQTAHYAPLLAKGNLSAASRQDWYKATAMFTAVDQQYGAVKEFKLQGFEFVEYKMASGPRRFVRMVGILVRTKQNTDFTFVLDPTASAQSEYLYGFDFSKKLSK